MVLFSVEGPFIVAPTTVWDFVIVAAVRVIVAVRVPVRGLVRAVRMVATVEIVVFAPKLQ